MKIIHSASKTFDVIYSCSTCISSVCIFGDFWKCVVQLLLRPTIKSFIQGFLPGIALKIFLILLPSILMFMSKVEGLTSVSSLERRSASKYYIFIFFNVFLTSIIAGSALEQLQSYLHQSANEYVLHLLLLGIKYINSNLQSSNILFSSMTWLHSIRTVVMN